MLMPETHAGTSSSEGAGAGLRHQHGALGTVSFYAPNQKGNYGHQGDGLFDVRPERYRGRLRRLPRVYWT